MKKPFLTSQRCFYQAGFNYENEQSRIEDQEVTTVSDLESILQNLHAEIVPGVYLEADRSILIFKNNIVEKEEDSEDKAEPEETDKTRSTITFK